MFTEARLCTLYVDQFGPVIHDPSDSGIAATVRVINRINKGLIKVVNVTVKPKVEPVDE